MKSMKPSLKSWVGHHFYSVRTSLRVLRANPLATALTVMVIAVALTLPAMLYLMIDNLEAASKSVRKAPEISLFLKPGTDAKAIRSVRSRLEAMSAIAKLRFVSSRDALSHLEEDAALSEVVQSLPENPLPDSFVLEAKEADEATLTRLRDSFAAWDEVEEVQLDTVLARKLDALLDFGHDMVALLAALLAFALAAITGNTIRLQIYSRRDEIEVSKLIGATDSFIRRPFLYFGVAQGLLSGLAALILAQGLLLFLNGSIGRLATSFGSDYRLHGLGLGDGSMLFLLAGVLGWLGAFVAVSRSLHRIDPH
jgi:cell division transport system permease protein